MKKVLLLAGIFTLIMNNTANAEYYRSERYYEEQPRYVRSSRYVDDDYEYQRERPRYQRVRRSEAREIREPQYRQRRYYEEEYENENKIRPYIGIDVATSKMDFKTVTDSYGYTEDYGDYMEDSYKSVSLVVGMKFNKYLGAEAFIQQSSEEDKTDDWGDKVTISYSAIGLDFIGYMPINQELELLASLGLAQYNFNQTSEYTYDDGYDVYTEKEKDSLDTMGIRLGIGAQYNITNNLALRGMARYIKLNDDDIIKSITEFSLGLRYMF